MTASPFASLLVTLAQATPAGAPGNPAGAGSAGANESLLLWGLLLFGLALALVVVEVFVPTGGIIGAVAAVCSIGAVICLFGYSQTAGLIGLAAVLISGPVAMLWGLKVAPNTPFVKFLSLREGQIADAGPAEGEADPDHPPVGATGEALSDLHPVGVCRIDGKRVDSLAVAGAIDKGAAVEVVGHSGVQARVKLASTA
ncbi:MAG: hypothetical protein AAGA57_00320 [Planctomycetota bacterium]